MDQRDTLFEMVAAALPGWMFVAAGLALLAMAMLTPAWLSLRQVRWQCDVMQLQAKQLDTQEQQYIQFDQALQENNSIVLTRLAFTQLHEQPADTQLLAVPAPASMINDPRANTTDAAATSTESQSASVAHWLAAPMPQVGVNVPDYQQPNTRLIRLCTGPSRWIVLIAGSLCILGGVWWRQKN